MELRETYDRIAEEWHKDHRQDTWWTGGTDAFISRLKPGDLVLDVGCGGGTKSRYLIKKELRVIGIDFSPKMVEIAKREVPEGDFRVLDLNDAGALGRAFVGIFAQAVLLHTPRKEMANTFKLLAGMLKEGGYLYVAVKARRLQGVEEETRTENDYGFPFRRFFSYFDLGEIESHMRETGLDVVFSDVQPSGSSNWIQVIGRK